MVIAELACFLAEQIIDYAISPQKIKEAYEQFEKTGSSYILVRLEKEAKRLLVSSETSGEAGEILLYSFAKHVLQFPQLMSKMSLKTSGEMHYHGADGVFVEGRDGGGLNLYWGEAKIHADVNSAINGAILSLAPFLTDPRSSTSKRSQDLFLLNRHLDLGDSELVERLKPFFLSDTNESRSIRYCGLALVGFNSDVYRDAATVSESVIAEFQQCILKIAKAFRPTPYNSLTFILFACPSLQ